MSTISTMNDTSIDVIENIFKDLRQSFNNGKTKSIEWRKKQLEQLYKMCDEQKEIFASANNADFHRPSFETLLFDCGSVSIHLSWK
jgi:acyl-CoA reductase-like NAD-dependent aldehyde dehydrogenase